MLARLALETRAHHAGADGDRLVLLDAPTPARYRAFLETVYGFELRYEQALIQAPDLAPSIVRACARIGMLRDDLHALGATAAELAALPSATLPVFRSEPQALGWVYVVERNTLLHNLLRRHLRRILPGELARAGGYLAAHPIPGDHYRAIGVALDAAARRANPSQIVEAACDAFASQHAWFGHAWRAARRLAS